VGIGIFDVIVLRQSSVRAFWVRFGVKVGVAGQAAGRSTDSANLP